MSDRTHGKAEVQRNMKGVFAPGKLACFRKHFNTVKKCETSEKTEYITPKFEETFSGAQS